MYCTPIAQRLRILYEEVAWRLRGDAHELRGGWDTIAQLIAQRLYSDCENFAKMLRGDCTAMHRLHGD
jgi:hypothetical protein